MFRDSVIVAKASARMGSLLSLSSPVVTLSALSVIYSINSTSRGVHSHVWRCDTGYHDGGTLVFVRLSVRHHVHAAYFNDLERLFFHPNNNGCSSVPVITVDI